MRKGTIPCSDSNAHDGFTSSSTPSSVKDEKKRWLPEEWVLSLSLPSSQRHADERSSLVTPPKESLRVCSLSAKLSFHQDSGDQILPSTSILRYKSHEPQLCLSEIRCQAWSSSPSTRNLKHRNDLETATSSSVPLSSTTIQQPSSALHSTPTHKKLQV